MAIHTHHTHTHTNIYLNPLIRTNQGKPNGALTFSKQLKKIYVPFVIARNVSKTLKSIRNNCAHPNNLIWNPKSGKQSVPVDFEWTSSLINREINGLVIFPSVVCARNKLQRRHSNGLGLGAALLHFFLFFQIFQKKTFDCKWKSSS